MDNNLFELNYKQLLMECLINGELCNNRTKEKTYKLFNQSFNINLQKGFPIVTGKKIFFDKALAEFKWIYEGRTDLKYLQDNNINWWNDFAINNKLGKIYGYQLRKFNNSFDQIKYVINEIKNNSRRALISLWNPTDLKEQALPCCYTQMNFVRVNNKLNMSINFRSSDLFLGLPYDIIFAALLLKTISLQCNLQENILGINIADAHIYECHKENVKEYYNNVNYILPKLKGDYNNYTLENYKHNKYIKSKLVL
jgi:thymidylate synthase|tara:strand:- start:895 stop:1656 length:762 start_codon:yes stop_codon:yes gene_type:complete